MIDRKRANYRFDEFELDLAKRRLMRGGEVVALKPKVFDLLAVLVENNGELLTKDDIFRRVWGDQFVEETNLTVSISAIRRALGETANEPRYITNVSGRGYYFNADIGTNGELYGRKPLVLAATTRSRTLCRGRAHGAIFLVSRTTAWYGPILSRCRPKMRMSRCDLSSGIRGPLQPKTKSGQRHSLPGHLVVILKASRSKRRH